jgi:hypothetical protein
MTSMQSTGRRRPASWRVAAAVVLGATLLAGCATEQADDDGAAAAAPRIVAQIDRPLRSGSAPGGERVFQDGFVRGTLSPTGQWRLRGEIEHPRLRCATYQVGLRFGRGDAECAAVDWQTDTAFAPSRMQCNNATVVHTGEGAVALSPEALRALNCVRISVRCTGACG